MTIFKGYVEWTQRVEVKIDAEKFCAAYAKERAEFDGDDRDFLAESLHIMAYDILHDTNAPEVDDGLSLSYEAGDYDVDLREWQPKAEREPEAAA